MRHGNEGLLACALAMALLAAGRAAAVGEAVNGFPSWAERVIHEWMNRARVDPQLEMAACGAPCVERACYGVMPPLVWSEALNRAARYHSDEMVRQGFFAHNSACTLVANIASLYPGTCDGSASCACVGGTRACAPTCSDFVQRVQRFGASPGGEIIASPSNPNQAFYLWLYEPGDITTCQFTSNNGHRWLILKATGAVGAGVAGYSTGDFGAGGAPAKIPSGAHYPQQAASVAVWANWYDSTGPAEAAVNVDGACTAMTLQRGTPTNGAWSATITGAGSGCHRYYFSFRDAGGNTVTYPTTGSLAIGSGAACPDWDGARPAACAIAAPSATPSFTPLPSATASATPPASATRTATATATLSRTPTASASATATASPTPSPTLPPSGRSVSGRVRYYSNDLPVAQVAVEASAPQGTASTATDASGAYALDDVPTADLLVRPGGGAATGSAVSSLDATYVLQSIANLRQLSAEQALACDVTGNGSLSTVDATLLLQRAVGLIDAFPVSSACGGDWVFIPTPTAAANQTLIPPLPGPTTCTPGGIAFQTLDASAGGQDFSALVFGDCTGNWRPPGAASAARTAAPVARVGAWRRLRGGRLALPIAIERAQPAYALDLRITYDPGALRPLHARLVGAARGAAMAFNPGEPGVARLAIAGATAIPTGGRPIAVVVFAAGRQRAPRPVAVVRFGDD